MKFLKLLTSSILCAFILIFECAGIASAENLTAFTNVHVISMTSDQVNPLQTVLVENDRIVKIEDSKKFEAPKAALVIDGKGKYLIPGLAEMHGHIPPSTASNQYIEDVLFLYLSQGITTVRGMLGHEGQLDLRKKVVSGSLLSPSLYLAGPSFNGNSVNSPQQASEKVKQQKTEGWDLLKIHPGLTLAEYDAMADAAHELEISFGGHVPAEVGLLHALKKGQLTFDHIDGYLSFVSNADGSINQQKLSKAVKLTRQSGAWIVPTMALWEILYGVSDFDRLIRYPELKYMPESVVTNWKNSFKRRISSSDFNLEARQKAILNRNQILSTLYKNDVLILMGTDAPQLFSVPGFSLHRELKVMNNVGMTPFDILKTGTVNVGKYFENKDQFGQVAVGQRADLVLLNSNPLIDIENVADINGVMIRGQWLTRKMIDQNLSQIVKRNQ